MQKPAAKRALIIFSVVVIVAVYGLYLYRERRLDRLYAEVADFPSASHGSKEAQAAVREIGRYKGAKSTQMLLSIAFGQTPFPWPDVQREAVKALAARDDPSISAVVAHALQPHQPLPTRQTIAEALGTLRCTSECVGAVLHYLERVWQGELNYEDRTSYPKGLNEDVKERLAKDQEALNQALFAVLRREDQLTLSALVQVYGLGTDAPSRFSLALVTRMGFRRACPAILQSEELAKQSSAESFQAPREEIAGASRSLECR